MALSINSNIGSLNAQRNLSANQLQLNKAMTRLSSGLRINSAADDAAGLSISSKMTAQIRGLNQAARNANDAISMAQTAEGALQETENNLQRMRELAVQAANGSYTSADRDALDTEYQALSKEIDRIASNTKFNGKALLDGTLSAVKFQVGADANQTISLTVSNSNSATLMTTVGDVKTNTAAQTAIGNIDNAIKTVGTTRGTLGALQNRFQSTISNLMNVSENMSAARARIMDADIAAETGNLTKYSILQQAGTAILAQANQQPQTALSLMG